MLEELKEQKIIYSLDFECPRLVREAISELCKQGIIFVPSKLGKGVYVHMDYATDEEYESYEHAQEEHFKTHYFNRVLPLRKRREELNKEKLMGRLEIL